MDSRFSVFSSYTPYVAYLNKNCLLVFVNSTHVTGFGSLSSFAGYIVAIVFITLLFADRLGRVSFALGVAGAGPVVSLQDVITSFAGWVAIGYLNLYKAGDRIQIGETRGDVIDISLMRTEIVLENR